MMKRVTDLLQSGTAYLKEKGVEHPRREAAELLAAALGMTRLDLYLHFEKPLSEEELATCRTYFQKRGKREPLSYILGTHSFFDCTLAVNPHVLIPRQETELLVQKIVEELSSENLEGKTLWDLCCGSGAIGIALKKRLPALSVVCSDLSSEALSVARENAKQNAVDIQFVHGDLLTPFSGKKTHFLVCNPPYVTKEEFASLDEEVRLFEPKGALVAENRGLAFYERLAQELPGYLHPKAKAWFEIGSGQGEAVQSLFSSSHWSSCRVDLDLAGHTRFLTVT